ncbi:uncharacterized protein A1O5_12906 [Cladophialophora psammophila CBS 110553]|uniref:Alpha/beta hydrolase fold-3 domain-containing protein n=1 Tax=Cladophialophora psammophila CBS 110553 TaxID=1182543 RepID=W9VPC2_9EURO|nr:uncharacterized protein A1O5_12906 [Cladophialophora psammophila CBS 110553]EXJ54840.1 hypothetical protein A1O5_12906 [Cladophialophora psammophila CBS 110553]
MPQIQTTLLEKLDLVAVAFSVIGVVLWAGLTGPFRGGSGPQSYKQWLITALVRKLTTRLSRNQMQSIGKPFSQTYQEWCKTNKADPAIVTLPSGCKGLWIGDHVKADYVFIFFHAGGFSFDGDVMHFEYGRAVMEELAKDNISSAFFFLEYTMVPYATYPTQLIEAIEAVNHVLSSGRAPSEIVLMGDSAGANLCLGILSHTAHPSPRLPPLQLSAPFKAAVLISPWIQFSPRQASTKQNQYKDFLTASNSTRWGIDYLAGVKSDYYAEAFNTPSNWWSGVKVSYVIATAGADEVLVDSISEWADRFKVSQSVRTFSSA